MIPGPSNPPRGMGCSFHFTKHSLSLILTLILPSTSNLIFVTNQPPLPSPPLTTYQEKQKLISPLIQMKELQYTSTQLATRRRPAASPVSIPSSPLPPQILLPFTGHVIKKNGKHSQLKQHPG
jgi:hypothetical protein